MCQPHSHLDLELNYVGGGRMRYFFGGREAVVEPGRLAVFWAGIPHQTLDADAKERCIATVPISWLLRWRGCDHLRSRLFAGDFILSSAAGDGQAMHQWLADWESGEERRLQVLALEMEARMARLNLEIEVPVGSGSRLSGTGSSHVERITGFLAHHFRDPLVLDKIAAAVGLHPKYATQHFRQACGMSLWDYLIRLRLAHAQRLLLTTDGKVLDIALEAGFGSSAAFYAAFKKHTGIPPRAFRLQAFSLSKMLA